MTIKEILLKLDSNTNSGLELTKRKGILTSTWNIYKRRRNYYFFDVNERIVFDKNHRYTRAELEEEFKNSYYEIDCELE
ncbi:hypothetical protein [Flavobacterium sp. 102]|uniref:hypothetical protein n=1 Tax=Flavobacterium sp. 102 TaxID=2135623 RepID=UPI000EB0856E|nr:hypothetical protein [Flavobacterium sp. 102]RKS01216.1 hypothetical protein C8C84_0860 [Flavobacterium sp. 102]